MYLQSLINRRTLFKNCLPWESKIPQFAQFYLYFIYTKTHTYVHCTPLLHNFANTYTIFKCFKNDQRENNFDSYSDHFRKQIYTFWKERKKEFRLFHLQTVPGLQRTDWTVSVFHCCDCSASSDHKINSTNGL